MYRGYRHNSFVGWMLAAVVLAMASIGCMITGAGAQNVVAGVGCQLQLDCKAKNITVTNGVTAASTTVSGATSTGSLAVTNGITAASTSVTTATVSGAATAGSLAINGATLGTDKLAITGTASLSGTFSSGGAIRLNTNTGTLSFGATNDVVLNRDAANTLALRNSTNAQTLNVYNTYTDAANYESGFAKWFSNGFYVGTNMAGTGVARPLYFQTGGTTRWLVDISGNYVASGDNLYDLGQSGAGRPRNVYIAGQIVVGSTATLADVTLGSGNKLQWGGGPRVANSGTSGLTINNNGLTAATTLSVPANNVLQLGPADVAAPVAQTIQSQSVLAGTANTAAPSVTYRAPAGTGTGLGGSFIVQVAPAGTTGTTQNAYVNALSIVQDKSATFAGAVSAPSLSLTTPLSVVNGGTGATTSTGSGANVLATSPTLTTPTLATPIITGSTTGTNPSAGNVGEVLCAWVATTGGQTGTPTCGSTSTTPVHLAITGAALNITTLTLTAGNWMVCARVQLAPTGGTTINFWSAGVSTVTGTLPSSMLASYAQNVPGSGTNGLVATLGCTPVQTSSSLPLYLVGGVGGTGGTGIDSYGYITATRVQ